MSGSECGSAVGFQQQTLLSPRNKTMFCFLCGSAAPIVLFVLSRSISCFSIYLFEGNRQAQLLHVLPVTKYASRQRSAKSRTYVILFAWSGCLLPSLCSLSLLFMCVCRRVCICMGFPLRVAFKNIQFKTDDTDR